MDSFWPRCPSEIPVHDLADKLGLEKTNGLPFLHAFTGCDVVSAFRGKGKKAAWQTWNVFQEASAVFGKLSQYAASTDEDLKVLEKFIIPLYDRSSALTDVDSVRLDMFARKQRSYEAGVWKSLFYVLVHGQLNCKNPLARQQTLLAHKLA